jgi:hypothetical protein
VPPTETAPFGGISRLYSTQIQTAIAPEIAHKFYALASQWESEVEGMPSTSLFKHPAYQEIIRMGTQIVPLLLQELKHNTLYWLPALNAITGSTNYTVTSP